MKELLGILCDNIDDAMINLDQFQILVTIDIITVLSEFIYSLPVNTNKIKIITRDK